jgi:hypothetical protein
MNTHPPVTNPPSLLVTIYLFSPTATANPLSLPFLSELICFRKYLHRKLQVRILTMRCTRICLLSVLHTGFIGRFLCSKSTQHGYMQFSTLTSLLSFCHLSSAHCNDGQLRRSKLGRKAQRTSRFAALRSSNRSSHC